LHGSSRYCYSVKLDNQSTQGYTCNMIEEEDLDEFGIWLSNGIERGWITEPFCNTHDGDPYMSEEEQEEWEAGGDPCQLVVRIKE
jgi:hypothetical protein